jgi:hypothetical protein
MDSSFEGDPEAWAELINIEKNLEKMGIMSHDQDGQYSSASLTALRDALEKYIAGEASLSSIEHMLATLQGNLQSIENDIDRMSSLSDDAHFVEHMNDLKKTIDLFRDTATRVLDNLGYENLVLDELKELQEYLALKSASAGEEKRSQAAAGEARAHTTFSMAGGVEKSGIKIFSSPSFDLINNAITDYREGIIESSRCIEIINEVRDNFTGLYGFFEEELDNLKEDDPEAYGRYKEVVNAVTQSRKMIDDGLSRLCAFFEGQQEGAGKEDSPEKGMEIFFRGIQQMAMVWRLLDMIRPHEQ